MLRVLHHICIETDCYEKSLSFYREVFGFAIVKQTLAFHGREYNTWLKNFDLLIELQTPKKNGTLRLPRFGRRGNGIDHICFLVDDIEREVARICRTGHTAFKKKDGSLIYRVADIPLCKVVAPEGTIVELREQDICF